MNGHKILNYILTLMCFAFLTLSSASFAAFMDHHPHNAEHGATTPAAPGHGTVIAMDDDGPGHDDDDGRSHEDEPPVPVPEPATLFLLAIGLLVVVGMRRSSHQTNSIQA